MSLEVIYSLKTCIKVHKCKQYQWHSIPKGLVDRPVPTDEGHGGEQNEPKNSQTKVNAIVTVNGEASQAGQHVEEESGTVDWRGAKENQWRRHTLIIQHCL